MTEHKHHIMLVEDSTSQALKLTTVLEEEGWFVTWVSTAEEAFAALRISRPDLVLLDYYLPGMRGDEICRRIRMHVDSRSLPIVILTSQEDQEVRGLDSGADDFILKSTNPDILLLRLRTLLQKSRTDLRILTGSGDGFRTARLLVIDDSATFLENLRAELETEGYEVDACLNPLEAVEALKGKRYDGVIIDLVMPQMDGLEVCRHVSVLRQQMEVPPITIVLTGADSRDNLSRALEAGADDFVGKSGDLSILKGRIRALLRRKFFEEENGRILHELRMKELEAMRERAAKQAAEARASLVEELQLREEELNRSREELKRANEAKDQFLAVLSHELRTPLTPVLAVVADRCNDESLPASLREDLAMVKRNIELEARLIDDLLDLTRIIKGKLEIHDDKLDLRDLVQHAVGICRSAEPNFHKITLEFDATSLFVRGDAMRLTQVLWNLLRNAVKFTPKDGQIKVRVVDAPSSSPQEPRVALEVSDTGMGIDPAAAGKIFDAFEQGSRKVTRQFGGLGLGLAISKAIVELHRGTLTVFSKGKDQGATFTMVLPVAVDEVAPDLVLPSCLPSTSGAAPAPSAPSHYRILLVEDHKDTCEVMRQLLARRGHEVVVAHTVAAGIEAAEKMGELDLLISDLGLPDGTGLDLMKTLRSRGPFHGIALSGYGMEEDLRRSREAGFGAHMVKPVNFADLLSTIEGLTNA